MCLFTQKTGIIVLILLILQNYFEFQMYFMYISVCPCVCLFCVGKQVDRCICINIHVEKEKWSLGISLICFLDYVCYVCVYLMSGLLRYNLDRVKFIFFMCKILCVWTSVYTKIEHFRCPPNLYFFIVNFFSLSSVAGNHYSNFCPCSFALSRLSNKWAHIVCSPIMSGFFHIA